MPAIGRKEVLLERALKAEQDGRRDEAIKLYQRILAIDPIDINAIDFLAVAEGERDRLLASALHFDDSVRINPDQPAVWYNRGINLSRMGLAKDALASFDRALVLRPRFGAAHLLRASTLARMGRYQDALTAFDETLCFLPDDPITATQRGVALQWCGRIDEALKEFERATRLDSANAGGWIGQAALLLLLGDLPGGFRLYEWRWRMGQWLDSPRRLERQYPMPLWLGESDISGKVILIYPEQGYGDVFQFCRYATLAAARGAYVILESESNLMPLMATVPGVARIALGDEPLPDHDVCCPMMSLPLAFGTDLASVPAEVPYLRADPVRIAAWSNRLSALPGHRVGLAWGGGARMGDADLVATEQRKSLPLSALGSLAGVSGCSFVSIQLGKAAGQSSAPPPGMILHDYTDHLHDFSDTAALMMNLDLIISVCTSTAHLAGALGCPVWLLNRFDTDWRWLMHRDDSPWYPTMRIFRQPRSGDWESVVQMATEALRTRVFSI